MTMTSRRLAVSTLGLAALVGLVFLFPPSSATPALGEEASKPKPKWIQLFNGKDLEGWKVKIKGYELLDNHARTFRVEDGLLKVSYDGYKQFDGKFGHIFWKEKYSNYILRAEYRFVGEQSHLIHYRA